MPEVLCQNPLCLKKFHADNNILNKGHGKYCSRACHRIMQYTSIDRVCDNPTCGKTFTLPPSRITPNSKRYCSVACRSSAAAHKSIIEQRFWAKIVKTETCWLWSGAPISSGYGMFNIIIDGAAKAILAHRYSYMLHYGSIPEDLFVCHNCPGGDNRLCVNPEHLWLGTYLDNIQDAHNKNRMVKPPRMQKIQDADVPYIRQMKGIKSSNELAEMFNVHKSSIKGVWTRYTFKHIP